jgi:excisionase family DNA binding protein
MRLLTAKEISVVLNIPLQRVYELARLKILPTVVLGERQIRFDEDALREWIARGGYVQSDKDETQEAR